MKSSLIAISIVTLIAGNAFGQRKVKANLLENTPQIMFVEENANYNNSQQLAQTVVVAANTEDYESAFTKFLSEKYKFNFTKSGEYMQNAGATILDWKTTPLGITTKVVNDGENAKLVLFVMDSGKVLNMTDNPLVMEKVRATVKQQITGYYTQCYDAAIEDNQKEFDKSSKSHAKLVSEGAKLMKGLTKNESKLSKITRQIPDNELKIKNIEAKIKERKNEAGEMKSKLNLIKSNKDAKAKEVQMKQEQLNTYSANNQMGSKDAERTAKDLEKLRKEQTKIESEAVKNSQEITKVEEKMAKEETNKAKVQSKLNKIIASQEKVKGEVGKLKGQYDKNQDAVKQALTKVDSSKLTLDKLKQAKSKLSL